MSDVDAAGSASVAYRLPMFPLSTVLFPSGRLPLHVFEPRYRQLTADCLSANGELGIVLITRGREVGGGDDRVAVGTVGHIDRSLRSPDGRWLLEVSGRRRVRVVEWLPERPYPLAMVEDLGDPGGGPATGTDLGAATGTGAHDGGGTQEGAAPEAALEASLEAALSAVRRARALLSESGQGPALAAELEAGIRATSGRDEAGWLLCDAAPLGDLDRQRLLETGEPGARLELVRSLSDELSDDLARMLGG